LGDPPKQTKQAALQSSHFLVVLLAYLFESWHSYLHSVPSKKNPSAQTEHSTEETSQTKHF
jgi:hypothetical protein